MASTWGTSWGTSWGASWDLAFAAVPDVSGLSQSAATAILEAAGFVVVVVTAASSVVPQGDVILQAPAGGSSAPTGSTVTITVSTGDVDLTDARFQGRSHNTQIRWLRKQKETEASEPSPAPEAAEAAPTQPKAPPRSTGIGEIQPVVAPLPSIEIEVPTPKVVALVQPDETPAPAVPEVPTALVGAPAATPVGAPAAAAAPITAQDLAALERELTAFAEGIVKGFAGQLAAIERRLQAKADKILALQKEITDLRRREINRQRAEELARRIAGEE